MQPGDRMMIGLWVSGPDGEEVEPVVVEWADAMGRAGREADVAEIIEQIWEGRRSVERFIGAIDSWTGQVVMSVPTMGWLGLQNTGRETRIPARAVVDEEPPGEEDRERKVLLVFAGGAIGQHPQIAKGLWRDEYLGNEGVEDLAEQVLASWSQFNAGYWFICALDSWTGGMLMSAATLGWLALRRARAYDAIPLAEDRTAADDPLNTAV